MQIKRLVRMTLSLLVCNIAPFYAMAAPAQNYIVPPIAAKAPPTFKPSGPITPVRPANQANTQEGGKLDASQAATEAVAPVERPDPGSTDIFRRSRPDAFAKTSSQKPL